MLGRKIKGSMGSAENVTCSEMDSKLRSLELLRCYAYCFLAARSPSIGRSLDKKGKRCENLECAAVCEYGFKLDEDGCPSCKCDDPCEGYVCPEDEECVNVKESTCTDFLCPTLPVCKSLIETGF